MNYWTHNVATLGLALLVCACAIPNGKSGSDDAYSTTASNELGNVSLGGSANSRSGTNRGGVSGAGSGPQTDAGKAQSGKASESLAVKSEPNIAAAVAAVAVKAEQLLAEGTELFDKGDYKGAIRKLQSAKDASAPGSASEQGALKYLAFSYCVTGQKIACKALFSNLLQIAPNFQLSRAEVGHPLWGPVFREAKASASTSPAAFKAPQASNTRTK